jgi:hypothetical protein
MLTDSKFTRPLRSDGGGDGGSGGYEVGADASYFLTCSIFLIHNPPP